MIKQLEMRSRSNLFAVRQKGILSSKRLHGFFGGPKGPIMHVRGLKTACVLLIMIYSKSRGFSDKIINNVARFDGDSR